MKAIITGASSGIGADMARILSKMNYDLVLVARRKDKLQALKKELKSNVEIEAMDISNMHNCMKLYNKYKDDNIDILINNAGFGVYGEFLNTSIDKEVNMIDLNVKTVHILTKLFLNNFIKNNYGYILNVSSSAAFLPGPLMASYYGTKSYVYNLTLGISEELKRINSNVYVGVLCPGPVDTEFNNVAKCNFAIKGMNSVDVSNYAIKNMFKHKKVIIPGKKMKMGVFFLRLLPKSMILKISYSIQNNKK